MYYQKVVFRLAVVVGLVLSVTAGALSQDTQDPTNRARNVKPELKKAYRDWLDKDVTYIITDEERKAFKKLATDDERERFIEEFWRRRDPDPDTDENEFKEEYYERIAYANEHFTSGIPGWKTDRGRIYITYGKPDERETHPMGGSAPVRVARHRVLLRRRRSVGCAVSWSIRRSARIRRRASTLCSPGRQPHPRSSAHPRLPAR